MRIQSEPDGTDHRQPTQVTLNDIFHLGRDDLHFMASFCSVPGNQCTFHSAAESLWQERLQVSWPSSAFLVSEFGVVRNLLSFNIQ